MRTLAKSIFNWNNSTSVTINQTSGRAPYKKKQFSMKYSCNYRTDRAITTSVFGRGENWCLAAAIRHWNCLIYPVVIVLVSGAAYRAILEDFLLGKIASLAMNMLDVLIKLQLRTCYKWTVWNRIILVEKFVTNTYNF